MSQTSHDMDELQNIYMCGVFKDLAVHCGDFIALCVCNYYTGFLYCRPGLSYHILLTICR